MKNCVECNEQLEDDAKFCSECRAKQPERQVKPKEKKAIKKVTSQKTEKETGTAKKSNAKKKKQLTYQERKQAIYDMTSQNNCGECGCKNCMQFAMQAASLNNSTELGECPYIDHNEAVDLCNNVEWL